MKINKYLLLICLALHISGCATMDGRTQSGVGHPFIGAESSAESFGVVNIATLHYFFPAIIITLPLTLIDLGFGIVTDTILLPFDLTIEPDDIERKTSWGNLKL